MTHRVPISTASLARLRASYNQFEQLSTIIAEALDLDPRSIERVDLPNGAFIVKSEPSIIVEDTNGVTSPEDVPANLPTRSKRTP